MDGAKNTTNNQIKLYIINNVIIASVLHIANGTLLIFTQPFNFILNEKFPMSTKRAHSLF